METGDESATARFTVCSLFGKNAAFCEGLRHDYALYVHLTYKDDDVIYQTRETVFHRDIQTPRRELKIRRAAEYF